MSNLKFTELNLSDEMQRAIDEMGFEESTEIQSRAIPLIRTGVDVIGRSQTGTGKTMAFAIPAIEEIDTHESKPTVQVIILTPTRELAQQGADEIKKLTKYMRGITVADVYGGAAMDRQITRLKRANVVIGTPGRIMDHMRRKTLKLDNVKMVVLDEADEMLSMGFIDDIKTILTDTPNDRQTVLFSATMPKAILDLTAEFQNDPDMIQVDKKKVTLDNISQEYIEVPMGRKTDALNLLLHFYRPNLCMIFCNTRQMVDEITAGLAESGFSVEGLHGDMKQSQRTKVMGSFKNGNTAILVCTDVAARGIDVNDVDYVINYDIPQDIEYYVHRIGRTGRAGKKGVAITICSGRKQIIGLQNIAHTVKSNIEQIEMPTVASIREKNKDNIYTKIEEALNAPIGGEYYEMVEAMQEKGYAIESIAAATLSMSIQDEDVKLKDIVVERKNRSIFGNVDDNYSKIVVNIGRSSRVAPNHIVAAMTERTQLCGKDIGKIEIYDDCCVIAIPSDAVDSVLEDMIGGKICGKPVHTALAEDMARPSRGDKGSRRDRNKSKNGSYGSGRDYSRNKSHHGAGSGTGGNGNFGKSSKRRDSNRDASGTKPYAKKSASKDGRPYVKKDYKGVAPKKHQ